MDENPYASPMADIEPVVLLPDSEADAERIRREHIKHEANVKSVGLLYYLAAVGSLLVAASPILFIFMEEGMGSMATILSAIYGALAVAFLILGRGLRKLDRRVRLPVGILSCLGLLSVPIGTLINGYILYLIFCPKGKMVFSPEYQEIIRMTPHVKYKTSIVMIVLLVVLLVVVAVGLLAALVVG